jgi:hypothetical protein
MLRPPETEKLRLYDLLNQEQGPKGMTGALPSEKALTVTAVTSASREKLSFEMPMEDIVGYVEGEDDSPGQRIFGPYEGISSSGCFRSRIYVSDTTWDDSR